MSEKQNFPLGWIEQLTPLLGDSLPDFLHSYDEAPCRGIRMRPGILPPAEAEEKVPWAENAWYIPLDSLAGATPAHEAGAYYLQEPSAMTAAAVLHPAPGDKVLDLCAAPGGKSTQLAAYLQGEGLLICNEPVSSRAQILSRNIERMGVKNAVVVNAFPEDLSPRWPGFFDKILVDAPCSGEGMFRRHPESRLEWNENSPAGCAERQLHILSHAAKMLRPGGKLVYSTCTFNATENEGVMQAFLRDHPEFSLIPFSVPGLPENEGMLHIWPHQVRGEGHFVALLEKGEDAEKESFTVRKGAKPAYSLPSKEERNLTEAFLREEMAEEMGNLASFAGRMVSLPEILPPLEGIRVLRLGLHLGEVRGKLFIPDHALALAVPGKYTVDISEEEARLYQNGQVLPVDEALKGWVIPRLEGLQLGWGKASQEQMKNHYPKGLRK